MTTPIQYPLINGVRYDHSSIEIKANGYGISVVSIDYDQTLDPGKARGNRSQVVGRTRGILDATGKIKLYRLEFDALVEQLLSIGGGLGFMEVVFDLSVAYAEVNQPIIVDIVKGVRIKKHTTSSSEGNEAVAVECELDVMHILPNGKAPIGLDRFLR